MEERSVIVLLAAYNGEKFIAEQIESIIQQTYKNWQLFIRDDLSSDDTLSIILKYQKADSRIQVIKDGLGNLKSCKNFSVLMNNVKGSDGYFMFADQDDVWLPNKIEDTLKEMTVLENKYGKEYPLLAYTNFTYVDEQLKVIRSKKNFKANRIKDLSFTNILAQNPIYGCTMMFNKKLLEEVEYIPLSAENHDYWMALFASAFGKISYVDKKTILYRQHGKNISGHHDNNKFSKRVNRILVNKKNFEDVLSKIRMAVDFKTLYSNRLSDSQKNIIDDFINLSRSKNIMLLWKNLKNGVRRQTATQTLLFYFSILFLKKFSASESL
jgi:rhamnosyltransferase